MKNLSRLLKDDPLPWLLEAENPSVRYWTLVDLLGRPADDPEVQQARAAVMRQPLVQEIFSLQQPGGHWGEDESKPYTATGAVTCCPCCTCWASRPMSARQPAATRCCATASMSAAASP